MTAEARIALVEGGAVSGHGEAVLALCMRLFPGFAPGYLLGRLPRLDRPMLVAAFDAHDALIGFKLGYRRGETLFYSWLGGVHPDARRRGLGRRLTDAQHAWAFQAGYSHVETRTRAANNPMILLNLQSGFTIAGFEIDKSGNPVVIQRAVLS